MDFLLENSYTHFLEIGPPSSLLKHVSACAQSASNCAEKLVYLPCAHETLKGGSRLFSSLAQLYVDGATIDWERLYDLPRRRMCSIPHYPFQRTWVPSRRSPNQKAPKKGRRPHWPKLLEAGQRAMSKGLPNTEVSEMQARLKALNDLSIEYMAKTVSHLLPPSHIRDLSISAFIEQNGLENKYRRILNHWFKALSCAGRIAYSNGVIRSALRTLPPPSKVQMAAPSERAADSSPADLVRVCGEQLLAVLKGDVNPLSLISPNSALDMPLRIHPTSKFSQAYCGIIGALFAALKGEAEDQDRVLKVLEIGAGSGGTTQWLLPMCKNGHVDYIVADPSENFISDARKRYESLPFVQSRELNIDQDPLEQSFEAHTYDLIVGANTLHTTRDLRRSLQHVSSLLAPHGTLILWETTQLQPWYAMTFGLIDDWNRFEDTVLRKDSPLLPASTWKMLLDEQSYVEVASFPDPSSKEEVLGQHVFAAQYSDTFNPSIVEPKPDTSVLPLPDANEEVVPKNAVSKIYGVQWHEEVSVGNTFVPPESAPQTWVILSDQQGMGDTLATSLKQRNHYPILVYRGHAYRKRRSHTYEINPEDCASFSCLLDTVCSDARLPPLRGILHGWMLDADPAQRLTSTGIRTAQTLGCESVAYLIQALQTQRGPLRSAKVWLLSRGAQAVASNDPLEPSQALGWGTGRVAALEHPSLWGGLIDFDTPSDTNANSVLDLVLGPEHQKEFALRAGRWYRPRLQPLEHGEAQPVFGRIRANATYLITGGLGGLGLETAKWLVQKGAHRLLLTGYRALPPRAHWNRILKTEGRTAYVLGVITDLEAQGVSVHVRALDLSDERAICEQLDRFAAEAWPPIQGVIHAAGLLADHPMVKLDSDSFSKVIAPKANGAWTLHRYFENTDLDFFVLYSSAAALLGSAGQANYASANSFLDTLAAYRRSRKQASLSINWGPWSSVGAATRKDRLLGLQKRGVLALDPTHGLQSLDYLLAHNQTQAAVLSMDGHYFMRLGAQHQASTYLMGSNRSTEEKHLTLLQRIPSF